MDNSKRAEPSEDDDKVWQYYTDIINNGSYYVIDPSRPWAGAYSDAVARSHAKFVPAGEEHSSGGPRASTGTGPPRFPGD